MPDAGVDVIVPCYNYGRLLRECVASVLAQRDVNVRVLIIDDASPDDTKAVGEALAAEDSRVSYRRHAVNARHIATFNEGLEWTRAAYTLLLSADDLLTPGALRRAVRAFEANLGVVLVYGQAITIRETSDLTQVGRAEDDYPTRVIAGRQFIHDACATGDNVVLSPTVVVRTDVQHRLGGYHPRCLHTSDFEMWMRFAAHGDIACIDGPQAFYRLHGANMSSGYSLLRDIEQRKIAFDVLIESQREHIQDAGHLHRTAIRSLASTAFWSGSHAFDHGDAKLCRQFHELTHRIDPSFHQTKEWFRFTIKRAMGANAWRHLRPLVSMVKG